MCAERRSWLKNALKLAARYQLVPHGERRAFLEREAEDQDVAAQTLQRLMAIAQFAKRLDPHDVKNAEKLSASTLEVISRIEKLDPTTARTTLLDAISGNVSFRGALKIENLLKDSQKSRRGSDTEIDDRLIRDILCARWDDVRRKDLKRILPRDDWRWQFTVSQGVYAAPRFRTACVFDERWLKSGINPTLASMRFVRDIFVACSLFSVVIAFVTSDATRQLILMVTEKTERALDNLILQ